MLMAQKVVIAKWVGTWSLPTLDGGDIDPGPYADAAAAQIALDAFLGHWPEDAEESRGRYRIVPVMWPEAPPVMQPSKED
jgi:hypothetical protein